MVFDKGTKVIQREKGEFFLINDVTNTVYQWKKIDLNPISHDALKLI